MLGVFLDTETTGLDPFVHAPAELAFVIVNLLTGEELVAYQTLLKVSDEEWLARDCTSVAINGLVRQELDRGVTRTQAAREVEDIFSGHQVANDRAFFICQNPAFDRPFFSKIVPTYRQEALRWPYHWLDLASMYWATLSSRKQLESEFGIRVSKDSIASALGLPPEDRPHKAMNGVRHLLLCYRHLISFPACVTGD